jgi:D-glycero-alpha-D-manno-heptose 1-phosphate guanylyltransferase
MEALVLAGGFGTRLQAVLPEVPKPMAPIGGKPFLEFLLGYLTRFPITHFILCTGYKHDIIEKHFGTAFKDVPITYSVEKEPLGTGGAIVQAIPLVHEQNCVILNGDTFFEIDIERFFRNHVLSNSDFSIALKTMKFFDRYGTVKRVGDRIVAFEEKCFHAAGEINGGVYVVKKSVFSKHSLTKSFSLEKDFLEKNVVNNTITGFVYDGFFIDIGLPEDYARAQTELAERQL